MIPEGILPWSMLLYGSEWVIRVVMLGVVLERHPPRTAMTWLLVIFFLPWPGLVLYVFVGENRLPRRRIAQREVVLERLDEVRRRHLPRAESVASLVDDNLLPTVSLAEKLGYMPITFGNGIALMADSGKVMDALVRDIEQARHHVHLLFYIFAPDRTGQRIVAALERAVARGVRCRVLVDAQGSRRFLRTQARRLRAAGIDLHPALRVSLPRAMVARIDLRNHRKIAVIDGRVAYTGSQNLVDPGYGHRDMRWRDLMVRLTGPVVLELQAVFVGDWFAESDEFLDSSDIFPSGDLASPRGAAAQVLPSGPLFRAENYQRVVVAAMHAARRSIVITTPYFVPDEVFLETLETAAMRGVAVDLIVPLESDQLLVGNAARAYYERLLRASIAVHLFDDGLLHAKTMTIDDSLAFLGSSNFDIRSFALNFEINLIFYDAGVARALRCEQDAFRRQSSRLTMEQWRARPRHQRVLQNVARLLSPLL